MRTFLGKVIYRCKQWWWGVTARSLKAEAVFDVATVLNSAEITLFRQFSNNDQQHSYRVLNCLRNAGHTHPDLLVAALLHDIGKSHIQLRTMDRIVAVLGGLLLPKVALRWGVTATPPYGWKRPFVIKMQHPAWGATMAEKAGSSPLAVTLIQRHQDRLKLVYSPPLEDELLAYLQWADDQS